MLRMRLGVDGHLPCLTVLLFGLGGCGSAEDGDPEACGARGSITDLSAEPQYSADYLHRFTVEGCPVRLDVIMTRTGACGPPDLVMGTPLGASTMDSAPRIYVRGSTTSLGGAATGFDDNAVLPPAAADTGFRQGDLELHVVPNDDSFLFFRSAEDGHVEAWPLDRDPIGCV
jgi:hypothetical protein